MYNTRRGGFSPYSVRSTTPISQSTTHENPELQNIRGFPCFEDGDVVISLSPAPFDTLFLHSNKLSAFSDIFRAGLDEAWSSNKIAGVRNVKDKDSNTSNEIVVKRYELDFANELGDDSDSDAALANFVGDVEGLSLEESEGSGQRIGNKGKDRISVDEQVENNPAQESDLPGTSMLVGKVRVLIDAR
jgi:hypothetical protein